MSPCLVITSEIKSQPKIPFRTILEFQILTGSQPLLDAAGGSNKRVLLLKTVEKMGGRMAIQKGEMSMAPNLCRVILRSCEDSALFLSLLSLFYFIFKSIYNPGQ